MPPFKDFTPSLAKEPDLIGAISRDVAARGLVGEEDAGLLVYLAYSSRKLRHPLSVIIRGPSGSGKDQIQRIPAVLMPPRSIVNAMLLTPRALLHGKNGWLRNKIILGGERRHEQDDAQRDRTLVLRMLLSEGYVTQRSVADGQAVVQRQDGPVSYSETTTQKSVFQEDLNRCLTVRTDPSEDLTGRVVDAVFSERLPGERGQDGHVWLEKTHHEFQEWLKPVDVRIPYGARLAKLLPKSKIDVRRIAKHLRSLIEVVAYVHQGTRERDPNGCVLATLDDYAVARRLIARTFRELLDGDYSEKDDELKDLPEQFTTTEARDSGLIGVAGAVDRNQANKWTDRLVAAGLIVKVGTGPRGVHVWRKTQKRLEDLVLPTAEDLL